MARDPADAAGPLVNIRDIVFGRDARADPAPGDGVGPLAKHVEIADVFHLVDLVGARWPGADLAEYDFTVGLAVPLHVGEAGVELQGPDHVEAHLYTVLQIGVIGIAQRDDLRADPLVAACDQRPRPVPGDIVIGDFSVHRNGVEGVFLAFDEFLHADRLHVPKARQHRPEFVASLIR